MSRSNTVLQKPARSIAGLAADLSCARSTRSPFDGSGAFRYWPPWRRPTIPIVFTTGGDPVQQVLSAASTGRAAMSTGVSWFSNLVASKALGLLHELVPNAAVIALLVDPKLSGSRARAKRRAGGRTRPRLAVARSQCQHAERNRRRVRHHAPAPRWRAFCRCRPVPFQPTATNCCVGSARCHPGHVHQPRIYRRGRADQLWQRYPDGYARGGFTWDASSMAPRPPTCRSIRPPNSNSGSILRRPKRSGSKCRPGSCPGRRGDRVGLPLPRMLLHLLTAACGTTRKRLAARSDCANWGEADSNAAAR